MKNLKTKEFIAPFSIGLIIGLIFIGILNFLELPEIIIKISRYFPLILPILAVIGFYIASLIGKIFPSLFQLAKFVMVGALNTLIHFGIFNLFIFITGITQNFGIIAINSMAFTCSVVNSYFWNKFWTFQKKEESEKKEFAKFFTIAWIGFFLNNGILHLIVNIIGPQFEISKELWANAGLFVAILCVFMWNFLGYKLIVFKK